MSTVYLYLDPPVHSVGTMPYNTSSIFIVCATSVRVRVISLIVTVDNFMDYEDWLIVSAA